MVTSAGVLRMFTYGALARHAAERFNGIAVHGDDHPRLLDALREALAQNVTVPPTILIKGSRAMALDQVANALAARGDVAC